MRESAAWDPFEELLSSAHRTLHRMMDEMLGEEPAGAAPPEAWRPAMDLRETPAGYTARLEIAGVPREAIQVSWENRVLVVQGGREADARLRSHAYQRLERPYGPFYRSWRLPADADADSVSAHYRDGVLEIQVNKATAGRTHRVEIQGEQS